MLMRHVGLFIGAAAYLRSFAALYQPLALRMYCMCDTARQFKIDLRSSIEAKDLPLYLHISVRNAGRNGFSWGIDSEGQ